MLGEYTFRPLLLILNQDIIIAMTTKQLAFFDQKKRVQGGVSTTNVVMSASINGNADIFPQILALHVPDGSRIADVTYGNGVFWRNVDVSKYELFPSDIATGIDCRNLPYQDESFDVVVFDPPYMEGLLRNNQDHKAGNGSFSAFREYYSNGNETSEGQNGTRQ